MENCLNIKPDPNFYKVDRQRILDFKPLHKRLSCNFLNYDYEKEEYYKVAHQYLIRNFYSLFNHISNEFTPNLIVKFDTTLSCNGTMENRIQLGTKILALEGFTQQHKVDAMYATMIHEMLHKRRTNADLSKAYMSPPIAVKDYYVSPKIPIMFKKLFSDQLQGDIFNILEDRRIEKLGIEEFPGYVFFFDQMRALAIEMHKTKTAKIEMAASFVIEYLMFKILLPELLVPFMQLIDDTYKGAKNPRYPKKQILDVITSFDKYISTNYSVVYSDNVMETIKATHDLYNLIPKRMRDELIADSNALKKGYGGTLEGYHLEKGEEYDEEFGKTAGGIEDVIEEEIGKAETARNGNKNKQDDVEKSREEKIEFVSVSEFGYENVVIYNPKCKSIDQAVYKEALKMSSNIARNLGFLSSKLNQINQDFELMEGDIDEDELYSIGFSNNIFYEEEPKPGFDFDFGILIDESGSMKQKKKMENAKLAALSCVLSSKDSKHVNLFVYGHSQGRHGHEGVELYEYYNSKRRVTDWKNVFAATASGGNADGYAIAKVGEIMIEDSKAKNKILVVISDGMPSAQAYGGDAAEKHVRGIVNMLEKKGIEVIQICIDNIDRSSFMFKHYIPYDSMGNFIKKFREILQKKLSQFTENL